MDDLKTSLEHLAWRVEDRPDAFVRLERRRRARTRTRRLTAGILAVAIAVTGTLTAYSAFTTPSPRGPSTTPSPGDPAATTQPIAALWPEHDTAALRAAQEAVEDGDPSLRWRLDAEETAVRFVRSMLGWTSEAERLHHNAVAAPSGLVMVDVVTVPASCEQESCDVVRDVILQLIRHGGEDGVWSVISAESSVFNMQFRIGEAVRVGEELEVISGHPSGSEIAVGVKVFEPCTGFHEVIAVVHDHRVSIPIVGVEEGCLGYVYALTPPRRGQTAGDLFEGRSGGPIDLIAVAPVFIGAFDGSGPIGDIPQPEEG